MPNFTGNLRSNEIFSAIYNMIISQQVYSDNIAGTNSQLVDADKGNIRIENVSISSDETEKNVGYWMYSYIYENGKLVELNSKNRDKYIGKRVKLRFSGLCEAKDGICNACMGNLVYKLNVKNVGIVESSIGSILKNISMKAFHDSVEKSTKIDVEKAFGE